MAHPSVNYRELINSYSDIARHKECIATELRYYPNKYLNVINHPRAVTCLTPDDHTVVIMHLRIDQYRFYEVVVVAGPDYNKLTNEIIPDIWRKISRATQICG
ncbi:hypothetical protein GA0061096_3587 [Fictibacillus enclensis]|uniref:Uncharacterized protein n=1 Tax=Fictibacillus enclensis TaxID=1017270 RepID=A0A0V8J550_9BACL|nr:hypothetical protein [Fictibacillus enclensis]KSU81992.1 hypothetical protein AS030_17075 [Fictibacillus enclensis]SCC28746.1 hypothetical protein GA0061096_3587 [Fictibacillus enclensis]